MATKTVIDTNILVSALSSRSAYHWLIRLLLEEKIELYITTEIVMEYEEVLKQKYSFAVAEHFLLALKELPNVHLVQVYFNWNLLNDEDDNKFADCYISANAEHLITNDNDFNTLKTIAFPSFNVLSIQEFEQIANS
jgi:putative PIN family toxin of toxin-antitoxin system